MPPRSAGATSSTGWRGLDAFTRGIEQAVNPRADVSAAIAHERALVPRLGGRTVFDDRGEGTGVRPAARGQLPLFPTADRRG